MKKYKTYDKDGQYIDSFVLPDNAGRGALQEMTIALNNHGRYLRSQFSASGKTLVRSYTASAIAPMAKKLNLNEKKIAQVVRGVINTPAFLKGDTDAT
jgi:hypothetical protein